MKQNRSSIIVPIVAWVASVSVLLPATGLAQVNTPQVSPDSGAQIQKLQKGLALAQRNEKEWPEEPLTQWDFAEQQKQIERLIERVKRGEKVSPQEIDQVLESPQTPY